MKIAGIVLIIAQIMALIPVMMRGDSIFDRHPANLVGFFSPLIVGVILLIIHHRRSKK